MPEFIKKKLARQQELINTAKEAQRALTAEEQREFDTLQGDIEFFQKYMGGNEPKDNPAQPASMQPVAGPGNPVALQKQIEDERKRSLDITKLCRSFNIPTEKIDEFVEKGNSLDDVRSYILDQLQQNNGPVGARALGDVTVQKDAGDKYREAAAEGLMIRAGVIESKDAKIEGSREFAGMSLRSLAIESLEMEGQRQLLRKSPDELFDMLSRQYLNPTSAFPMIMDQAIQKSYIEGHKTAEATFDKWCKKGSLNNFLPHDNNWYAGTAGDFLEVPEGQELKHDTMTDVKAPQRKLHTYGRQFSMSREAFINDDIGVVTSIPAKYARAARRTQNKQCYQILTSNSVVHDGVQLFHATHKNVLTAGTDFTQNAMQRMIMALNSHVDHNGDAIVIKPAIIIVPVGYEFKVYALFNSPTINDAGNTQAVNPLFRYRELIDVVSDPTLNVLCGGYGNVMPWYLIGNTNDVAFMQIDYLNGNEIPKIQRSQVAGRLGFVWDIYLDWGITVMDPVGAVKNPGIQINEPLNA